MRAPRWALKTSLAVPGAQWAQYRARAPWKSQFVRLSDDLTKDLSSKVWATQLVLPANERHHVAFFSPDASVKKLDSFVRPHCASATRTNRHVYRNSTKQISVSEAQYSTCIARNAEVAQLSNFHCGQLPSWVRKLLATKKSRSSPNSVSATMTWTRADFSPPLPRLRVPWSIRREP